MENVAEDGWNAEDLDLLFAPVATYRKAILAVSGGADSTALMWLYLRWAATRQITPDALVVTIDHGLRPEAAKEAELVAAQAAKLGLRHQTLAWTGDKPQSNLQDAARTARYRLLASAAIANGAEAVLTAHTFDDQAETFLLALARGSGVYGLAAMPTDRLLETGSTPLDPPIHLIRPLLSVSKSRLIRTIEAAGLSWSEDPSNTDTHYARVQMREAAPALGAIGLTPSVLVATAGRLARARDALEIWVDRLVAAHVIVHPGGFIRVDIAAILKEPTEVALRTLSRCIRAISGAPYAPRLDSLERLNSELIQAIADFLPLTRTLGDVTAQLVAANAGPRRLWFYAEAGRAGFERLELAPGESAVWNNRILLRLAPEAAAPMTVGALGPSGKKQLSPEYLGTFPRLAFESIAGGFRGETIVAVPAVGYRSKKQPDAAFLEAASLVEARLLRAI